MNEQVKKVIDPLKSFWNKLSSKAKKLIFIGVGAIAIVAVVLSVMSSMPKYAILYPSLDEDEAQEVIAEIESRGIDYKEDNGTIYVPESEEASLRMDLSNEGHPYSSYNYDFFLDNVDIMTTDSEKKILEKYQLNKKLESVIESIDSVKDASVTITLKDDSGYVLSDDSGKATAGVSITLNGGKDLTSTEVLGIKRLVAKSVPDLDEEDVVIINTATGAEFDSNDSLEVDMASFKMLIQSQYENDIESKIGGILNPIYGSGNYQVAAKSDIDVDKSVKEIITYNPSQDNRGVISKEDHQYTTTDGDGTASGVAGTDSNAVDSTTTYSGVTADDGKIYLDGTDSYEYLVSQVKEQIQKDSAEVTDLTVSVAINAENMSTSQKAEIAKLVANSAGINESNVYVFNTKFAYGATAADAPTTETILNWVQNNMILVIAVGGGIVLLIILLIIVNRVIAGKRRRQEDEEYEDDQNLIDDPDLEDFKIGGIKVVKETKTQALKQEIQEFSSQNPEIAAQLIRTWLKGDDADA